MKDVADGAEQRPCVYALKRDAAKATVVKCRLVGIFIGMDQKTGHVGERVLSKRGVSTSKCSIEQGHCYELG